MIEREKTLDAQVTATEDLFVQIRAKFLKLFQAVRHILLNSRSRLTGTSQNFAGTRSGRLARVPYHLAIHENFFDASGQVKRTGKCGRIDDGIRIEQHEVR